VLKDWFFREGRLSHEDAVKMCDTAIAILQNEGNVLTINGAVTGLCNTHFFCNFFAIFWMLKV
jgi:hypothetical protein